MRFHGPQHQSSARPHPPRNYFSRSEQYRLLTLVFALLLVIFLAIEAGKPKNWAWLFAFNSGGNVSQVADGPVEEDIDNRLDSLDSQRTPLPPGVFLARSETEPTRNTEAPLLPGLDWQVLGSIRDDTMFRKQESTAWYDILSRLAGAKDLELAAWAGPQVGFTQLHQQPDVFRGRVVTVHGVVRRASKIPAGRNSRGIDQLWQVWLFPEASKNPIVVYALDMPTSFPEGLSLAEPVVVHGVFFKRWAYMAKRGIMTAPLVLARSAAWVPLPAIRRQPLPSWRAMVAAVMLAAVVAVTVVCWVFRQSRRHGHLMTMMLAIVVCSIAGADEPTVNGSPSSVVDHVAGSSAGDVDGPRALLSLFQIDDSQWRRLVDRQRLDAEESTTLLRLLDRMPDFPLHKMCEWQRRGVMWDQVADQPDDFRVEVLEISGRLRQLECLMVPAAVAERFRFRAYFRSEIALRQDAGTAVVFTRRMPERLQALAAADDVTLDERVRCQALFLKLDAGGQAMPRFMFAAPHLQWYPDSPHLEQGITEDHVALANFGWDVGTLDSVTDYTPLGVEDREAFYQLLAAANRDSRNQLAQLATTTANVTDLLRNPEAQRGRLYTFRGTARQALRINVTDVDIVKRMGIRHYYEVIVFLEPDAIVRVTRDPHDREGKVFATYPVAFCVAQLPEGMPQGELINEFVEITGAYLKLWSYRSDFLAADYESSSGRTPRQFSPLLIGRTPVHLRVSRSESPRQQVLAGVAFIGALLCLWLGVWWYGRGDERFRRSVLSRKFEVREGRSLNDLISEE